MNPTEQKPKTHTGKSEQMGNTITRSKMKGGSTIKNKKGEKTNRKRPNTDTGKTEI